MSMYVVEKDKALKEKSVEKRIKEAMDKCSNNPVGNAALRVYCNLLIEEKSEWKGSRGYGYTFHPEIVYRVTEKTVYKALDYLVANKLIEIEGKTITII